MLRAEEVAADLAGEMAVMTFRGVGESGAP